MKILFIFCQGYLSLLHDLQSLSISEDKYGETSLQVVNFSIYVELFDQTKPRTFPTAEDSNGIIHIKQTLSLNNKFKSYHLNTSNIHSAIVLTNHCQTVTTYRWLAMFFSM